MEELFESLFALIIVIIGLAVKFAGQTKKVRQNAPGKAAAPERPVAPAASVERMRSAQSDRPVPAQPTVRPTVHPATEKPAEIPDFWQQMSKVFGEQKTEDPAAAGHEAVGEMAEGDSRECEHGSLGGSMAYEGHQEGRDKQEISPRPAAQQAAAVYRPVMSAQEMRRAVIVAEILKRPQERMAEQARRWNPR